MATLFELIRSFETRTTFAQQLGDYLSHQDLGRTAEQYTRHFKRILDTAAAAAKTIFESNQRFAQLCIEFKWPPPWHIPASLADQITNTYHAGKLTPEEIAEIFASFYTPEETSNFGKRWARYGWLAPRLPFLQEVLDNHINGRYISAVCVLLPQIEGSLREALGTNPRKKNVASVIRRSRLTDAATQFFTNVVLEDFVPDSTAPIPELSRHAILHGKAINYGTPTHSLKLILIADIIFSSIDKQWESRRSTNSHNAGGANLS